ILQNITIRDQSIYSRYQHRFIPDLFASPRHVTPLWQTLQNAIQELFANINLASEAPDTGLKLAFFSRRPLLGKPKVDAICLNMLLAENLQEKVRIMPEDSDFELQVIYDLLNMKQPSKRHNRV